MLRDTDRDKMIEAAKAFNSQGCLIGRCFWCEADFAIEQLKAERERIASELIDLNRQNPDDFLTHLSYYVQELAGRSSTAHRMLDDLKKDVEAKC